MPTLLVSQIPPPLIRKKAVMKKGISLLEKSGEYAMVAKAAVKKMKKAEEDYKSLLVRYKEAKCEIETLNGELTEAYTKVKFLELKWFKQMPR